MKSSTAFFLNYYIKKHLGFLANVSLDAKDVFWKNFYRLRAAMPVKISEETATHFILQSCVEDHIFSCYVRKAPSSDLFVFRQIFEDKEYSPVIKLLQKKMDSHAPLLIIDAGANVGYTSIFFKLFFPQAAVVAVEPDVFNAEQIKLNLAINQIDKIEIIIAGVWSHDCWLELKKDKSRGEDWGYYVEESRVPTNLKAIDILNLQQLSSGRLIDILKVDIEGAEVQLFENPERIKRLLSVTKYLAIEIHDDMANRADIEQVLTDNNFTWFKAGELTIATNRNLVN